MMNCLTYIFETFRIGMAVRIGSFLKVTSTAIAIAGAALVIPGGAAAQSGWVYLGGSSDLNPPHVTPLQHGMTGHPRARMYPATWVDSSGYLWMYGGTGRIPGSTVGALLADLWRYNPTTGQWTWVNGSFQSMMPPVYPAQAGQLGSPGSRSGAVTWVDSFGHLWLYGGHGISNAVGSHSDLWKYNPFIDVWTYEGGTRNANGVGSYPSGINQVGEPPARLGALGAVTASGDFLLFGGLAASGHFNDLWKMSPSSPGVWILLGGGQTVQSGSYPPTVGGIGYPGSRSPGAMFTDSNKTVWMWGGYGRGEGAGEGRLNDLWRYDAALNQFVFEGGSSLLQRPTDYPAAYGLPGQLGGRNIAQSWSMGGRFWVSGGMGTATGVSMNRFNDLWAYEPGDGNWRFMDGPPAQNEGVYPAQVNSPGLPHGRYGAGTWAAGGKLYMFGGSKQDTNVLDDMWVHPGTTTSSVGEWSLY